MGGTVSDISLLDILPSSITGDPTVQALAEALDLELGSLATQLRTLLVIYPRISEMDEPLLSIIARQWHCDYWDPAWPLTVKRETCRRVLIWHLRKGTPWAVEDAAGIAAETTARVSEWFEYGGEPGYFRLHLDVPATGLSQEAQARALAAGISMKNTRSHVDEEAVRLEYEVAAAVRVGATLLQTVRVRYLPAMPGSDVVGSAPVHLGAGVTAHLEVRLTPAELPD